MRLAATWLCVLLLTSCASTPEQQSLAAADLRDALVVARPLMSEDAGPYLAAIDEVLTAIVEGEESFGYESAFRTIEQLEPLARVALMRRGQTAEEAEATLALVRIALRRVEQSLTVSAEP